MDTIEQELMALGNFMPLRVLLERTELARRVAPEPFDSLIPSTELAADGVRLARLTLLSPRYICDVDLAPMGEIDFCAKNRIANYRLRIWEHEVKEGELVKARFSLGQIDLIADFGLDFRHRFSCAANSAEQRDEWLRLAVGSLPIALVSK